MKQRTLNINMLLLLVLLTSTTWAQSSIQKVKPFGVDTIRLRYGMATSLLVPKANIYDWLSNKNAYHIDFPRNEQSGESIGIVTIQPKQASPAPASLTINIPDQGLNYTFVLMVTTKGSLKTYDLRSEMTQVVVTKTNVKNKAKGSQAQTSQEKQGNGKPAKASFSKGWEALEKEILEGGKRIKTLGNFSNKLYLAVEDIQSLPHRKAIALRINVKNRGSLDFNIDLLTLERTQKKGMQELATDLVEGVNPIYTPKAFRSSSKIKARQAASGVFFIEKFAPDESTLYKLVIREKDGERRLEIVIPHKHFLNAHISKK